jgi:predicted Zn-dependent protease
VPKSGFYKFGQVAGVKFRKAKWMWESVAGSEDDAIRAEHGVGRDMAAVVREQSRAGTDPDVAAILDEISARLAKSVRNRLHRFDVSTVSDDQPTAFALPGGFIFVAESLVTLCGRDQDELAFVVAHEMAHVIRRHAIDRILSQKILSVASLASPGRGVLGPWIRRVGLKWLETAYSRDNELEADELGARLVRAAGYDPTAAIRLLERLGRLEQGPARLLGAYLSTHPPVKDRITSLRLALKL